MKFFLRKFYCAILLIWAIPLFPSIIAQEEKTAKQALPKTVNTNADEFSPILSPSGRLIYFVRANYAGNKGGADKGHDIWKALSRRGSWKNAENLGKPVNDFGDNGIGGISNDGNIIFLTNTYDEQGNIIGPGISTANRLGTKWKKPQMLWDAAGWPIKGSFGFYMTPNQELAILAANDTTQGQGKEDLYVLRKMEGEWQAPLSLGTIINTKGFEFAPFLSGDTKKLFFASNGHQGLGSADIFMSERLDDTWQNWSAPINLGPEVNTEEFDAYFSMDTAAVTAYFSSAPQANALGDLYRIALADIPALNPPLPIQDTVLVAQEVSMEDTVANIEETTVIIEELIGENTNIPPITGKTEDIAITDTILLTPKKAPSTASTSNKVDTQETTKAVDTQPTTSVVSAEAKKELPKPKYEQSYAKAINRADTTFENILFGFNEYKLAAKERYKVQYLVDFLQQYTKTSIKLNGYTDTAGSDSINIIFGEARCVSIKNYMVSLGVSPRRITTYSHGEKDPLSNSNQRLNRRVEVFLLKKEE